MRPLALLVCVLLTACPERTRPARGVLLTYTKEDHGSLRASVDRRLAQLKVSAQLSEDDSTLSVRLPEGADVERVKALLARPTKLELCAEDERRARAWCDTAWPATVTVDRARDTCALRSADRKELERIIFTAAHALGPDGGGTGGRTTGGTHGAPEKRAVQQTPGPSVPDGGSTGRHARKPTTADAGARADGEAPSAPDDAAPRADVAFSDDTVFAIERPCLEPRVVAANAKSDTPSVMVEFDRTSGRDFAELSGRATGRRLIILLDGAVQSAPLVMETITGGKAMISSGAQSQEALELLAASLAGGALPGLSLTNESTWGPPSLFP